MKAKRAMRVGQLIVAVLLTFAACAQACRLHRPMGDYVREAELIVLADTQKGGEHGYDTVASVTKVIKGDPKLVGTKILLGMTMSTGDAHVPVPATKVAILLRKNWRKQKQWPVLEAYTKAEEIAALRTLVGIYGLPTERQRLLALGKKALAGNAYCMAQLLPDLKNMRDPDNFDVMTALYSDLAGADQAKLVEIMASTGDPRAVPPLLKAMQSSDKKVSGIAASHLWWNFPGAPGVTEAFEKALTKKHLARRAARYLRKRRDDPALDEIKINKTRETSWMRAGRLGDTKAGRAAYLAMIEDGKESRYVRCSSATKLLPNAGTAEKERIRKALLPQLLIDAGGDNYIHANQAARILRGLHHADCLEALLALVPRVDFLYRKAARTATLAIGELGPEARKQAVARLMEDIGSGTKKRQNERIRTLYMLQLVWLGDKESLGKFENIIPESWESTWAALCPLQLLTNEKDEGTSLVRLLEKPEGLPPIAREWVVFCLGDRKEKRAVKVLAATLSRELDWTLTRGARDALICIGGPEVENEMIKLLTHKDRNRVRPAAIEVLFRLQGDRACDLARRMLREDDFGVKDQAMTHLMNRGTVDDLALLLPYCDYWKADRSTHYWAMQAVNNIRDRYNYDVNGPVVKSPVTK
jgi:HEAT repeat protein